jgi:hypothetical protein
MKHAPATELGRRRRLIAALIEFPLGVGLVLGLLHSFCAAVFRLLAGLGV